MNKIFKRVGLLSLGIALAGGAAVALNVHKEAAGVSATETAVKTLDFTTKAASFTGYSKVQTYGDFTLYGGQNNNGQWGYVKFGGKKANKDADPFVTNAYIRSPLIAEELTSIKYEVAVNSAQNGTVDVSLDVYSDPEFENVVESVNIGIIAHKTAATLEIAPESGHPWGENRYYQINFVCSNNSTTNGMFSITKVFYNAESQNPRGELEINGFSTSVLNTNDSSTLSYTWTPASGSQATISSYTWTSSDPEVFSVEGDNYTALKAGSFRLTLEAQDSLGENYLVQSDNYFVSNELDFEVGDNVAMIVTSLSKELSGINTEKSTHYGDGTDYSTTPNGVFALKVESGAVDGTYSFKNGDNYITWSSGNSLDVTASKTANSSWFVIQYDDHQFLRNAANTSRIVWWNNTNPRFACYERTQPADDYPYVSLVKLDETVIRGTLTIVNEIQATIRQNTVLEMQYNFVPADGDSATIASYTWSTNNDEVFSISGDFATAHGEGKGKITINATDTNGQEYSVSTSDINVVKVVTGSYEKKTSVSLGDIVTFVCESAGTQFAEISSNYGTYVFYEIAPSDVTPFTLVQGNGEGYYALKNSDNKYLAWKSGTDIEYVSEITDKASWSITFDEGNAVVTNKTLDGETARYIAWNTNSPRFAAYKGQTAVQLYGPAGSVLPEKEEADTFAQTFLDAVECHDNGATAPTFTTSWSDLADAYDNLSGEAKAYFVEGHADKNSADKVEQALARYDMLVTKYKEVCPEFISGRTIGNVYNAPITDANNGALMIIIASVALVSVVSVVTIVIIRKRRFHN